MKKSRTMDPHPTRTFIKKVKRVVFKVGTAVVTREDGRLAIGRVGAIFEQLETLNSEGYQIILVTSGAVGAGRQRLKYRKLINSSFADLQNPQEELDGKACAAVGQNCLMALYDNLFSQLDVTSSQLLVTDTDFRNQEFRSQLHATVNTLLTLRSIPIFNENDAISTRAAPYEDSSGIFWDNDSLAAFLAVDLHADLLVMLSDVDGLFTGPPSDPHSKIIHTYIREEHRGIACVDKSRVGRGGMYAKVKNALNAAEAGVPVIITSGCTASNIAMVMQGQRTGTLFHRDSHMWRSLTEVGVREMAVAARESAGKIQSLSSQERRQILLDIADALEEKESLIADENKKDVDAARQAGYDESLIARLCLKPGKIIALANSMRTLADMEDPIGHVLDRTELAEGLTLEKISRPLGVLLTDFESRPDALIQISSLAIRSGNGLLLKGGRERSNAILHKVITEALPNSVGEGLIGLVTSGEEISDLLQLDDLIDLVIPRGSNKLISQIKNSTKIPVLGHADGICHVYVDKSANMNMAKAIIVDSKLDYPAACNAMETLLVHKEFSTTNDFQDFILELKQEGVTLYGGPKACALLDIQETHTFHHEYSSSSCAIEIVDDVHAAIDHINQHGSGHTECIVAEDQEVAECFLRQVDSAAVFHNASTRFCDGARFGLGAEVGISTSKVHARGPVGVEGLLTTQWVLRGSGQVVKGDAGVKYTHRKICKE